MGTTSEHQSDSEPDHASLSSRNLHHLCHCTNPLPSGTCSEHALLTSHFVSPFTPLTSGFTSLNPLHLHYWYCTLLAYYRHKFLHSLVFFFFILTRFGTLLTLVIPSLPCGQVANRQSLTSLRPYQQRLDFHSVFILSFRACLPLFIYRY